MNRASLTITALVALLGAAMPLGPGRIASAASSQAQNPWANVTDTGLTDAIAAIEETTGGKVLEIRFHNDPVAVDYDAVVGKGPVISHVHIAAAPEHKVAVIAETNVPVWMVNWVLRADMASIQKAKLSLTEAVRKAQQMTAAPAVDAGIAKPLTADNAVLAYNIEVVKNGKPQRVVIDAQTGDRIANPDALLDTWSPEEALYQSLRKG
jgi:hypothetical protein